MSFSSMNEQRFVGFVRSVGYGLLLLAALDFVNAFIPAQFTNPVWEFQTLGFLVEHAPVPLLGLALVFYGDGNDRIRWEKTVLQALSWCMLLVGILFLLLLPLGLNNTWRINNQNRAQLNNQFSQTLGQIQPLKTQLEQATTPEAINKLLASLNRQGQIPNISDPEAVKQQLLADLAKTETTLKNQRRTQQAEMRRALLKNSVKWNLGAVICGVLFIRLWAVTRWARRG